MFETNVKSTSETLAVGTRMALPSNFPFSSGNASETALSAIEGESLKLMRF